MKRWCWLRRSPRLAAPCCEVPACLRRGRYLDFHIGGDDPVHLPCWSQANDVRDYLARVGSKVRAQGHACAPNRRAAVPRAALACSPPGAHARATAAAAAAAAS